MLKIGEFSKLSRISIRMLRHYDEIGLLVPEMIDEFNGYRYYSEAQLPIINRIIALREMGFSLTTIRQILTNYKDKEALRQYLMVKEAEVKEQMEKAACQLRLLETTIERLGRDEDIMKYNVTLKELSRGTVASVRKVIPAYQDEGMLWQTLMSETAHMNIQDGYPCYTLAIFHDGEHKEANVDVEVQKSVKGIYTNTENVVFKTVEPVLIASATYKGSYDQIGEVSVAVANWVRDNGYTFGGVSFFIYHVSPHESPNPEDWVTEVCYPVVKNN